MLKRLIIAATLFACSPAIAFEGEQKYIDKLAEIEKDYPTKQAFEERKKGCVFAYILKAIKNDPGKSAWTDAELKALSEFVMGCMKDV